MCLRSIEFFLLLQCRDRLKCKVDPRTVRCMAHRSCFIFMKYFSFSDEEEGNKSSDRRVKWVDQQASRCSEEEEEEGEGSSESDNDDQGGGDVRACSSVINFTHTPPESSQVITSTCHHGIVSSLVSSYIF